MKPYKNRALDFSKTVDVYFNLHLRVWSIRQAGRVVAHSEFVSLVDCAFVVNEAGRQRVLIEKKKNVHAFVRGRALPHWFGTAWNGERPASYNPYKAGNFVFKGTDEALRQAGRVGLRLADNGAPQLLVYN